jgi:hypothetical protein
MKKLLEFMLVGIFYFITFTQPRVLTSNVDVGDHYKYSDLVIIGRINTINHSSNEMERQYNSQIRISNVQILYTIKGHSNDDYINVMTSIGVQHLDPECCILGARYLMFLREGDNNIYGVALDRASILSL